MTKSRILFALLLAAGLALAAPARAAFDAYLQLGDIKGESTDPQHKDWIEIGSYQFDSIRASAMGSVGRGDRSGRVNLQELTITKNVDKTSPKLMEAAASGKHFQNATIHLRKAGGSQDYLVVKMENVFVTNVQTSRGGGPFPTETVSLTFGKIEWTYTPQHAGESLVKNAAGAPASVERVAGQPTPVATPVGRGAEVALTTNPALACCRITGATAAAPFMGLSVTVTITSTTPCRDAFVDYGDGSIAEGHALTGTSTTLGAHTYSTAGAKTIKVGGRDAPYWPPSPPKAPPQKGANPCTGWAPVVNVTLRTETAPATVFKPH